MRDGWGKSLCLLVSVVILLPWAILWWITRWVERWMIWVGEEMDGWYKRGRGSE